MWSLDGDLGYYLAKKIDLVPLPLIFGHLPQEVGMSCSEGFLGFPVARTRSALFASFGGEKARTQSPLPAAIASRSNSDSSVFPICGSWIPIRPCSRRNSPQYRKLERLMSRVVTQAWLAVRDDGIAYESAFEPRLVPGCTHARAAEELQVQHCTRNQKRLVTDWL